MIKKVKTSDLKIGMYVHDLNVPWMKHGFARNYFLLQSERQIEQIIQQGMTDVFIDTAKGLDATDAPTLGEAESALMSKLIDVAMAPGYESMYLDAKLESQWAESREIRKEALRIVRNSLNGIRLGRNVSIAQATPIVKRIADAVMGNNGTLVSLCRIKQRDEYTFQHSVSLAALLVTFCHSIGGFSNNDLIDIGLGALFHDVGKMKVPIEILNKAGHLTDEEFEIMKTHVPEGLNYLQTESSLTALTLKIVAEHHERYDGNGYPRGIARNAISLIGQMAAIVDVYDAITSTRVYHTALEPSNALARLYEWAGKYFDETMVHRFIKGIGVYPVGSLVLLESGRLAVVLRQGEKSLLQPLVRVVYDTKVRNKIPLYDLDLASGNCQDHIVGHEEPSAWNIDPFRFIERSR